MHLHAGAHCAAEQKWDEKSKKERGVGEREGEWVRLHESLRAG